MSETQKKLMYKITRPETHGSEFCIWKDFSGVEAEFDGAEIGEKIQVELVEMTDQEFEDIDTFEGW